MKKKVIFIICNGRSGSTVFSKFLGSHSDCFALSEPHYFDSHFNNTELCSCESSYENCTFWKSVITNMGFNKEDVKKFNTSSIPFVKPNDSILKKVIKYLNLFLFWKLKIPYIDKEYFSQIKNEIKLLESVMSLRDENVFIDASKSLSRAIFIMNTCKQKHDYSIIFLERDIRSIINSMKRNKVTIELANGINKDIISKNEFDIKSAISQVQSIKKNNELIKKIFRINVIYVNYEQFTDNPKKIFLRLSKALKLDWEETMLDLNHGDHHLLGGNYSRINAQTIKKSNVESGLLSSNDLKEINRIKL